MFEATFLGTAASTPSAERGLPAVLVQAGSERFLIDCGEGTQRQMLRAGSGFRRLGHVLLTHAHLDHVLGLGGLIATLGLMDLRERLRICGSRETMHFVAQYLGSLFPLPRAPVPLEFVDLQPGPVLATGQFTASCFPVKHRGTESLGYRFDTIARAHLDGNRLAALGVPAGPLRAELAAGRSVMLSDGRRIDPESVQGPPAAGTSLAVVGDAEEVDALIGPVAGADALVIEATFPERDPAFAGERGHLTAAEAGRLAAAAKVGALYLTHISGRYDPAEIAAEATRFFATVAVASDFDRISVTASSRQTAAPQPARGPI
jgi:ribonuclease Z